MEAQFVLNTGDAPGDEIWSPDGPIPPALRNFGKYPNVSDWLPGDLLLVSHNAPNWIARQIVAAQERGGYGTRDAQWQHAAVYMGESTLLEATRLGVRYGSVYDYVGKYALRVRRDRSLTGNERWRIAMQAGFRLRKSYDFSAIAGLLRLSLSGFWKAAKPIGSLPHQSVICSQLYADAYTSVTGFVLAPPLVTPAALSSCQRLEDIRCRWLKIR